MTPCRLTLRVTAAHVHCLMLAGQPNNTSPDAEEGRRIEALIQEKKQDLENRGFRVDEVRIVTDEPSKLEIMTPKPQPHKP